MDATTLFVIGIVGAGALALLGVFTIAFRRGPAAEPMTGSLDKAAVSRDKVRVAQAATSITGRRKPPFRCPIIVLSAVFQEHPVVTQAIRQAGRLP